MIGKDSETAAAMAADWLAETITDNVAARGRCVLALSGGETPWKMLEELITRNVPWHALQVAQVDERVVPGDDTRRNLLRIHELLCKRGRLEEAQLHGMPVERPDPDLAAREYSKTLAALAGSPPVLDIVQLGLGIDGHTASLFAGDSTLKIADRDAAATEIHSGTRRVTLTYSCINRARAHCWLVTGAHKAARLRELISGQGDSPAVRVSRDNAFIFADAAAVALQSAVSG
ncbi:MAG TPA: 6-phosphogluconolactonase [Steroidobacteraceae bacterium]|nr:6-phosphogluconolactonase [Steroidobacteraceae bacterium]